MSKQTELSDKDNKAAKPSRQEAEQSQKALNPQAEGEIANSAFTQLQQTVGNQAVQAMMVQRKGNGPKAVDEDVAASVKAEKGKGQQLEEGIAAKAGETMGQDFSDVKIHTDAQADSLSRDIGAKAFTTGNDIFFKEGEYNPNSSEGQHLISHELTHVVQQGAGSVSGVQGKMTVNDPNDKYEAEADKVADAVLSNQAAGVQREADIDGAQRAEDEEEVQAKGDESLQREEEEEMQAKGDDALQREEEEEMQAKADDSLQKAEDEEEVQMQEEEEEMQAKADDAIQRVEGEEEEEEKAAPEGDLKEEAVEEKEEEAPEEEAAEEEEEKAA